MKFKTFLSLLVVAGVLAALAYVRLGDEKPSGAAKLGAPLFADLPVNQVAAVTITDSAHSVNLVKGDTVWQVEERGGFAADFDELRDTVVKLSRLKVGRSFAGSPESLKRLSLLAPTAGTEEGRGKQLTLKDASGKILADVILGQPRETDGGGSGGQYLKQVDDDMVYLVDGSFRWLKTAPADWLQREILNISAKDVAAVTCYADHTQQAPVYILSRPKKGEAPQMSPVPQGRSVDSAKIDQVFDALAPLSVDDVTAADDQTGKDEKGPRLVFRFYDGRQITLFPASAGAEKYTLRLYAEDVGGEATVVANAEPASSGDKTSETGDTDKAKPAEVKSADQLNRELGAWIFSIKKWQFDGFITQADALLEAPKQKDKTS